MDDKLKLLFVVDGRSPTALNWMRYFVDQGHQVHMASIYPATPEMDLASLNFISLPFSGASIIGDKPGRKGRTAGGRLPLGRLLRRIASPQMRTRIRHWLVPPGIPQAAQKLKTLISELRPDLLHAMRIPYEGMLGAHALGGAGTPPLVVSVWGNDFTLHAPATRGMAEATRFTLHRVDALHTDCRRDLRLSQAWGFEPSKPSIVLPGSGGIRADIFNPAGTPAQDHPPVVINPRGMRVYVRNRVFFSAIPQVLQVYPQARFICPAMAGDPQAKTWVETTGIAAAVDLLPRQTQGEMAVLFRGAQVVVSPSVHDGTPNSLLEAMACGCFPVVGDIESLREWITPGVNGLLVDPEDPSAIAEAIILALDQPGLRESARRHNTRLIAERASYGNIMKAAEAFYRRLLAAPPG